MYLERTRRTSVPSSVEGSLASLIRERVKGLGLDEWCAYQV